MKKIVLFLIFTLPLFLYSQKTIKKDTNEICLPYYVAKKITKDLNKLDSLDAVSNLTNKELKETQKKVIYKDSIIGTMKLKEENYVSLITKEQEKFTIVENQNVELRKEITKVKRNKTFIEILGGSIIAVLGGILIFN